MATGKRTLASKGVGRMIAQAAVAGNAIRGGSNLSRLLAEEQRQNIERSMLADQAMTAAPEATPREELLREAMRITTGDRNKAYGNPEDNFANIAAYWRPYFMQRFGVALDIDPQDVAHLMILMKMARLATNPGHRDSLVDVAGYSACAADCLEARIPL